MRPSRQEGIWSYVLPRIGAAIAQFIAPIATPDKPPFERFSPKRDSSSDGNRSRKQSPPPQAQPESTETAPPGGEGSAQVIPFPGKDAPASGAEPMRALPAGINQALLQLMGMLQGQRASLLRWLGMNAYRLSSKQQKKNGRVRKGAIIDERVG